MSKDRSSEKHSHTVRATIDQAGDAVTDTPHDDAPVARVFQMPCAGLRASVGLNPTMSTDAKLRDWACATSAPVKYRMGA
jgi:hypothetical protein